LTSVSIVINANIQLTNTGHPDCPVGGNVMTNYCPKVFRPQLVFPWWAWPMGMAHPDFFQGGLPCPHVPAPLSCVRAHNYKLPSRCLWNAKVISFVVCYRPIVTFYLLFIDFAPCDSSYVCISLKHRW